MLEKIIAAVTMLSLPRIFEKGIVESKYDLDHVPMRSVISLLLKWTADQKYTSLRKT